MKYNKGEEKLWEGLEEVFKDKDDLPSPIYDFQISGLSILIWKEFRFGVELLETYPYKEDGEVPMLFILIGPIELIFENKWIYRYLYKRKYKHDPTGI